MRTKITILVDERVDDDDTNPIDKYGKERWDALAAMLLPEAEKRINAIVSRLGGEIGAITWWHTKDGVSFATNMELSDEDAGL